MFQWLAIILLTTLCFIFYLLRSLESTELVSLHISSNAVISNDSINRNKPINQNLNKVTKTTRIELDVLNASPTAVIPNINDSISYRKSIYQKCYKQTKTQENIDCEGIIKGNIESIKDAKKNLKSFTTRGADTDYFINTTNCTLFKRDGGYIDHPLSPAERDFPLAFGVIVYKNVEEAERLLRAIYRPHNYYCLHIDRKTDDQTTIAFEAIAGCFDNVFIVPNPVDVKWATITVLRAELLCMQYLWKAKSWKYYINLTGQEFPLKTNLEIVQILKAMGGANIAQAMKHRQAILNHIHLELSIFLFKPPAENSAYHEVFKIIPV